MIGIQSASFKGKKVMVRVDFNLPFDQNDCITDDRRIRNSLPTIQKIISDGGIVILLSHLGRPKNGYEDKFSLRKIQLQLANLLAHPVLFSPTCVGPAVKQLVDTLEPGSVLLLENLRFFPEETTNDKDFAQALASLADVYVNDAFGTIHRNHLSISLLPHYFNEKFAGYLLEKEIQAIDRFCSGEPASTIVIMGGGKWIDKTKAVVHLTHYANHILIGGALALPMYTNQQATSIRLDQHQNCSIHLPTDVISALSLDKEAPTQLTLLSDMLSDHHVLDIGPATQAYFADLIVSAKTLLWAGPMGIFEWKQAATGTTAVAHAIAKATEQGAYSIIGGGDTAAAVTQLGYADKFSHISTGGGSLLAYIAADRKLPGLEPL
ncbi:MAG: phosphoglycerate kinase [Amoebophilaceae bacterium]|nr:phosphoglycerate kinase [Amoebophilaceae bacterium]